VINTIEGLQLTIYGSELVTRIDRVLKKLDEVIAKRTKSTIAIVSQIQEEQERAAIEARARLNFIKSHIDVDKCYLLGWGDVQSLGREFYHEPEVENFKLKVEG
jgi:hypothetical protein